MPKATVTNAVLLEKLNNQQERQKELFDKVDKLDVKLTQNFESIAHVLQQGYVKKEELPPLEKRLQRIEEVTIPEVRSEISKRVHKDAFKPYQWVGVTLATTVVMGVIYLFGNIVYDYIKGGPPP